MTPDPRALIIRRRRQIELEIKDLQAKIATLQAELPDLLVAEKVLTNLAATPAISEPIAADTSGPLPDTSGKPEGTPTVPEMINIILSEAEDMGLDRLEPKLVAGEIARRWWPSVKSEEVSPIMWRMWKRGQLLKEGPRYSRAKNETGAESAPVNPS